MNSVEAISWFENCMKNTTMPGARAMFSMALSALREQQERENPKPLTLDKLRKMDGDPVFVTSKLGERPMWYIVDVEENELKNPWDRISFDSLCEGSAYSAYCHKPEED